MAMDREETLGQATWAATRAIELVGSDALADVRRAHQLNPNDVEVLRILAALETGVGEPEEAIVHAQQVLRLNPRGSFGHMTFNLLAFATFGAKQYAESVGHRARSTICPA
jgi:hypothetical protein